ncbi:MAG: lysylphosphatidylglycerol synthase transmembrane domain-containing protein [Legionellaceae bacterium]|nr:lysylphosphatidylglycerol synthase transmembrane domain-containing protein [Legionellaceae bacterium]
MKYLIQLVKLLCTCLLLGLALKNIDFSKTMSILYSINGLVVLGIGIIVVLLQITIAGLKLIPILNLFSYQLKLIDSIKLWFVGSFFSQIMISFVGGDAMRLISLVRSGVNTTAAMRAILLDRVLGFIALQVLYLIAVFFLLELIFDALVQWTLLALAWVSILMIVGFISMSLIPEKMLKIKYIGKLLDFLAVSRYLFVSKSSTFYVFFLGVLIQFLNVVAIYFIAILLGASLTFFEAFVVGVPVMLISLLPISTGGWGVRENSMVIGFNLIGIPSEIALSVSIVLGISLLLGSLPGAVIFWRKTQYITGSSKLSHIEKSGDYA